jgi:hypothetical protein
MSTRPVATHVTIHLARYDDIRALPAVGQAAPAGHPLVWLAGSDEGRHGSEFASTLATEFAVFGVHPDEASAQACATETLPCFADAVETWSAVFVPVRMLGGCNWIADHVDLQPTIAAADGPLAVLTSAGWVLDANFDVDRAMSFGAAVGRVRDSITGADVPGLLAHQNFVFPGLLVHDGVTLTFWQDEASMKNFAYRPGSHKTELDAFRLNETCDRTSFTRLRPIESHGTWWGTNPFP